MRKISNNCVFALLITIALSIGSAFQVHAKKLGNMPEVSVPIHIRVDNNQVYIADDQADVHLYSMKGNKLTYQKHVAHRGEGPQECISIPFLVVNKEILYMFTFGKCMFFSKNGEYIREFRAPPDGISLVSPVGKNFVVMKDIFDSIELSISIYSNEKKLEHKKLMYVYILPKKSRRGSKIQSNWYPHRFFYSVYEDKVIIFDSTRGLFAEIFDANGNKISQVKLDLDRIKIKDEIKAATEKKAKSNPGWEVFNSKYYMDFPEYYPPFRDATVDDGKVYFITYNQKNPLNLEDKSREIIVTDLKGKLLKKTFITIDPRGGFDTFFINKGKFYYVVDNVETEEWELHVEDIK